MKHKQHLPVTMRNDPLQQIRNRVQHMPALVPQNIYEQAAEMHEDSNIYKDEESPQHLVWLKAAEKWRTKP